MQVAFMLGLWAMASGAEAGLLLTAPPECPGPDRLVEAVAARAPAAARALATVAVTVEVTAVPGTYTARLTVGEGGVREVSAQDCAQVVDAIALVLALALRDAPPPPPPPPAVEPPPAPTLPPAPAVPTVVARPPAVAAWSAGIGVGVVSGVVPGARPSVPAFLEVRRIGPSAFRPAARVGFIWAAGAAQPLDEAAARFSWFAAELEPCAGWAVADDWLLDACLRGRLGALQGRGEAVLDAAAPWRAWASLGAAARARYDVFDAWFVEADLSASVNLRRDRFYFGPDLTAHRAAPVGFSARVQGGWSFW